MVAFGDFWRQPDHVLDWCRNLVESINDGGVWGIPRSGLVFRINHKEQTLTLVAGDREEQDFDETRKVFAQIGWRVL